jgi:hypothetical protein
MNIISPTGYQREERKSLAGYEDGAAFALLRSRAAVTVARNAIKAAVTEAIERCDPMVNDALLQLYQTERRTRAFITPEDRASLLETILQAVDDHYFLPLNLMSEESNEQ